MLISSYIQYLENRKKLSDKSIDAYASDMKKYALFVLDEGKDYVEVDELLIQKYIRKLKDDGLSESTIARSISAIKGFYNYINRFGNSSNNPIADIDVPRRERVQREFISEEDIEKLLSVIDKKTYIGLRDYAMIKLLYETDIKLVELLALTISDINLEMNYVKCKETKRKRILQIPHQISENIQDYIDISRKRLVKGDQNLVFLNYNGEEMTRQGFWKMIKKYQKNAGITKLINTHTLKKRR